MHSGTFHEHKLEGATQSTEAIAPSPKAKNPSTPGRAKMGQVEPVNYSNAALEQRMKKATTSAEMGKSTIFTRRSQSGILATVRRQFPLIYYGYPSHLV